MITAKEARDIAGEQEFREKVFDIIIKRAEGGFHSVSLNLEKYPGAKTLIKYVSPLRKELLDLGYEVVCELWYPSVETQAITIRW